MVPETRRPGNKSDNRAMLGVAVAVLAMLTVLAMLAVGVIVYTQTANAEQMRQTEGALTASPASGRTEVGRVDFLDTRDVATGANVPLTAPRHRVLKWVAAVSSNDAGAIGNYYGVGCRMRTMIQHLNGNARSDATGDQISKIVHNVITQP